MKIFNRLLGFLSPYKRGLSISWALASLAMVMTVALPELTGRPSTARITSPGRKPAWRAGLRSDLLELAADAAARAWETAVGLSADAGLGLSADADLARRAARALGTPSFGPIAARSGIGARELVRQALAWRHGGLAGLELLGGEWDPVADEPESADLLKAAGNVLRSKTGEAHSVKGNRITAGRLQLRLGRDLRWYPYARSDEDWEPSGSPDADPVRAVADL